jgi:hypothetical protein
MLGRIAGSRRGRRGQVSSLLRKVGPTSVFVPTTDGLQNRCSAKPALDAAGNDATAFRDLCKSRPRSGQTARFPSKSADWRPAADGLKITSRWFQVISGSILHFLSWRAFPLGKNENKWHKSAFYIPGRNSTIDYL